jgi:hypothetical protein
MNNLAVHWDLDDLSSTFCDPGLGRGAVAPDGLLVSAQPCLATLIPVDMWPVFTVHTWSMGRPRKFERRKQVTFSVGEGEYKWIELQAGGNVSNWCREQLLGDYSGVESVPEVSSAAANIEMVPVEKATSAAMIVDRTVKEVAVTEARRTKRICKHGKEQGYNCWQCGGLARGE